MSSQNKSPLPPALDQAIKLLGDDWILCIIGNLADRELRFCELERAIANINPVTLTDRLKKLETQKIVKRKTETVDKLSVVYELTPKGRAILPVIKEMAIFAKHFL